MPRSLLGCAGKYLAISYTSHSSIISRFILLPVSRLFWLSWLSWLPACLPQTIQTLFKVKLHSHSQTLTHAGKFLTTLFIYCLLFAPPYPTRAQSICIYANMLHTFAAVVAVVVWFLHLYQPQFISGHDKRRLLPLSPSWLPKTKATTKNRIEPKSCACQPSLQNNKISILFFIIFACAVSHFLTANNNFSMAKLYFML